MRIAASSLCLAIAAGFVATASAKLPPLDDAAKAKAAETAARAAWTEKVGLYQLCQSMDRVAATYRSKGGSTAQAMPAPAMETSGATPTITSGARAVASSPPDSAVAAAPMPGAPAAALPPCADPGPFAYTPVADKPLEAAGAHSPPGMAISPPSTNSPAARPTPAANKPIEAAGAHSPPGAAVSPPNQNPTSAEMTGKTKPESKP